MRIAQVIGTVTLSRCHASFAGARLRLAVPLSLDELRAPQNSQPLAEELVVWDDLAAGIGSRIALTEGAEAAQPFRPHDKPVDAYNAAILDSIEIKK
jgi:ethanolamine utilization protein EutN